MATAILGVITTPITEISKLLLVPLKKQVDYFAKYNDNVKNLKKTTKELRVMRGEAFRRGEVVNRTMEEWLRQAEITLTRAQNLVDCDGSQTGDMGRMDSKSCCTNMRARYMISRRAAKLLKVISEQKSSGHMPFSRPAPPPSIEVMPTGDFEAFESTKEAMSKIIEALRQNDNELIGVYGMGGVGKTSIIREVGRYTKITNMFDEIVIATVSQNPDLKKIQSEIAEGLGLRLEEETEHIRSLRLAERLKKEEGRVFIILDDVWERLELSKVGIPSGEDKSNCKIALTTRNLDVCSEMYCNVSIKVDTLSEKESWSLFKKVATNIVESPDLNPVAKEIARECAGLPIALVTLGRVLRNKEKQIWEDAAYALRGSKPLNIKGMHENVFSCLRLSFDKAQNEESKLCYLYCSLFPEDYDVPVEDLLRYGMGEGLFFDVETVDEARHRVHSIINNLMASCLLLSSNKEKCVKLHDVFRDLAISIATNNDYSFMVQASSGMEEWPRKYLEYVMRMSLISNEFSTFSGRRDYPELLLLLLQNNMTLEAISDDFFAGMRSLLVLDLSNIPNLVALPPSLSCLTNLKTLSIENNNLKSGSALGGLNSLEILSLRKTSFAEFPKEIQNLTKLRLLDLTDSQVGTIPAQVIPSLCHLEELYMGGSFDGWEVKGSASKGMATLTEVFSLKSLNTLHIDIGNYECLTEEITCHCPRLNKFHIHIGSRLFWQSAQSRSICFSIPDKFRVPKPLMNWMQEFLQKVSELSVAKWKNLSSLEHFQPCNFQFLKHLLIQQCDIQASFSHSLFERFKELQEVQILSCSKMDTVFHNNSDSKHDVFPRLERLKIQDAPRLTALWRGVAPSVCFKSLQHVAIKSCAQIKTIFPLAVAEALNQLQYLEISDCESLESLINNGVHDLEETPSVSGRPNSSHRDAALETLQTRTLFPQLETLKLRCLEKLSCFSQPWYLLEFTALKCVNVLSCPHLKKLPFGPKSFRTLIEIKAEKRWLDELEFEEENTKILLQKCFIDIRV